MKAWNNIENGMKKTVSGASETPPPFVWDNIEQELSSRPSKFKVLYLFVGIVGVAIIAGFGYMSLSSPAIIVDRQAGSLLERMSEETTVTESSISEKRTSIELAESKEVNQSLTSSADINLVATTSSSALNKGVTTRENEKSNLRDKAQSISSLGRTFDASNKTIEQKKNKDIAEKQVVEIGKTGLTHSTQYSTVAKSDKVVSVFNSAKAVERETFIAMNLMARVDVVLENNREVVLDIDEVKCPTFGGRSISIYPFVELNGLLGKHFKSLDGDVPVSVARSNSENSWYTWGGSALVGINVNRNFYVGSGLEWSQSKDKFFYGEESLTKMVITFDQDTGLPIDTSFVNGTLVNKGEIRYNALDVPVYLGAVKSMGKWELGLEAGVLFNMSFKVEGKIFNDQLDISRVENETDVYKSKVGLGMRASVLFRRYLNDGIAFQVKPGFKRYFGAVSHDSYALPTKMQFIRLELGLRKDF